MLPWFWLCSEFCQDHAKDTGCTNHHMRASSPRSITLSQYQQFVCCLTCCYMPWLGPCHSMLMTARAPRLIPARTSRLGLCHNTPTPARTPRLGLCHNTLAPARTPKLELCHNTDPSTKTKATFKCCYGLHSNVGTVHSNVVMGCIVMLGLSIQMLLWTA